MRPYRIPFSHLALLLETGKLPPIVDDGEELPEEEEGETHGHNGTDHPEDDAQDVEDWRALLRLLDPDDKLAFVIVAVDESHPTVVVIVEPALLIRRVLLYKRETHLSVSCEENVQIDCYL